MAMGCLQAPDSVFDSCRYGPNTGQTLEEFGLNRSQRPDRVVGLQRTMQRNRQNVLPWRRTIRDLVRWNLQKVSALTWPELHPDGALSSLEDLHTAPSRRCAAILVRACIRIGGQELADQVAVRSVNLHAVESGLGCLRSGVPEAFDQCLDLRETQLHRMCKQRSQPQRGRRHGTSAERDRQLPPRRVGRLERTC